MEERGTESVDLRSSQRGMNKRSNQKNRIRKIGRKNGAIEEERNVLCAEVETFAYTASIHHSTVLQQKTAVFIIILID